MDNPKTPILRELIRTAETLLARIREPCVIGLLVTAVLCTLALAPAKQPRTCHLDESKSLSRYLTTPYAMPGPIAFHNLSEKAQSDFTLEWEIPVVPDFHSDKGEAQPVWSTHMIENFVSLADSRDPNVGTALCTYGAPCNKAFFEAFSAYPVAGLNVLVVGSISPWAESICLSFKANSTTTVDFTVPIVAHDKVRSLSIAELDESNEVFDVIVSYSSLEHDGLGRYGDPLNPSGDFERMSKLKGLIHPGGRLYLGVPNGKDFLLFNAHRIYGRKRFPMLIDGWKLLGTFGENLEDNYNGIFKEKPWCMPKGLAESMGCFSQPVNVLELI